MKQVFVLAIVLAAAFWPDQVYSQTNFCSANGTSARYEWIKQVTVGGLTNPSTGVGYQDFTSLTASVSKGSSIPFSLTPGFSGSAYSENWKIFIDLNQDKDFLDPGEEVASVSSTSSAPVSGSFILPSSALTGQTRMRVVMKWGSPPSSCGSFSYGEVEDYTMSIAAGSPSVVQTGVDEVGFQTYNSPNTHMLASTVQQNVSYGSVFRHYTYAYQADNGNDGKTQIYISKNFSYDLGISDVAVVDTANGATVYTAVCYPSPTDSLCVAYVDVLLGLENRVTKTYVVRFTNPQSGSAQYEYKFTLSSAKLRR